MQTKIILDNGKTFEVGAFPDRVDERDFRVSDFGSAPIFDWSKAVNIEARLADRIGNKCFSIKTKNQQSSSSCGGQAGSYHSSILEALTIGEYVEKSAKFIYSQNYLPGGGMYMRDIQSTLISQGDCNESILPSVDQSGVCSELWMERSGDINSASRKQAVFSRASAYASVFPNIDSVAAAVDNFNGVEMLVCGANNGSWGSVEPVAPSIKDDCWYHFVCGIGAQMVNGKKCIKIINSWGESIGDNGRQYITSDYFNAGGVKSVRTMVQIADKVGWCATKYIVNGLTTENLRMRESAGLKGKQIAMLPKGTAIDIVGKRKTIDGYTWSKCQVL
jgi:hypothetical protein